MSQVPQRNRGRTNFFSICGETMEQCPVRYSYFEKGCGKKCARDNPERQYGIRSIHCSWHCSCRTYFCCFPLALTDICPWPSVPILSNFFEKKRTQNHPQCLSGLSRALFPTTFLEIAVYARRTRYLVLRTTWLAEFLRISNHCIILIPRLYFDIYF